MAAFQAAFLYPCFSGLSLEREADDHTQGEICALYLGIKGQKAMTRGMGSRNSSAKDEYVAC